jgi:hypothetical protein
MCTFILSGKENKKMKIPKSLNFQKSGQRLQDSITFKRWKVDPEPCPNPDCRHLKTMPLSLESQAELQNNIASQAAYDLSSKNLSSPNS